MPMMAEANQMSQELGKVTEMSTFRGLKQFVTHACHLSMLQGVEFTLEIKNLALSDSKGHDLEKKIVVRVTAAEQKQVGPSAVFHFCLALRVCAGAAVHTVP